jgi:hypothetical protein
MLSTGSLSALGYEQDLSRPVIRLWNDTQHVTGASAAADDTSESDPALDSSLARSLTLLHQLCYPTKIKKDCIPYRQHHYEVEGVKPA